MSTETIKIPVENLDARVISDPKKNPQEPEISIRSKIAKMQIFTAFLDILTDATEAEVRSNGFRSIGLESAEVIRDLVWQCAKDLGWVQDFLPVFWVRLGIIEAISEQELKDVAFQPADAPEFVSETDDRPNRVSDKEKKIAQYFLKKRKLASKTVT